LEILENEREKSVKLSERQRKRHLQINRWRY
jgi:hypothetical protein